MISTDEALQTVLSVAQRLHSVTVPLHEAFGKVLAEDVRAPDPLPPYPASVKVINCFWKIKEQLDAKLTEADFNLGTLMELIIFLGRTVML